MDQESRQLAAILFTDIVGYTAMMQQDEGKAIIIVKQYISVIQNTVTEFSGKILNDYGDGSLCCFNSATQAVRCAIEIQRQLQAEPVVPLRIGLHVGELFFEGEKVLGDGVNVASRVQSLGQPNTILFSKDIYDQIKNQREFKAVPLGRFDFKNVGEPIEIFALSSEHLVVPRREKMEGKLKEIQKRSKRTRGIIIASVIILLVLSLIGYKMFSSKRFTGEKTIAVLPFENIGVKNSEEYISDGITQDIINKLSKISSLQKVIAWFSVRAFKNSKKSIKQIADELGVAAILTGTIQRQGGGIRIVTELVDVNTGKRLWGEDYNYSSNDLLSIQTDLAGHIANALRANLTSEEEKGLSKHYTENVDAYKLYRKGRYFRDQRRKESYDSAELYYKKAIELDPDYALAYSGLADCYTFNQKGLSQAEAIPIAREYANKALTLDSTLAEARTTIAFIQSHFDFNWGESSALLKKIISDNPNYPIAHLYYGNILLYTGKIDQGLSETKKALSLDPLSAVINYVLGRQYYYSRRYDSAITQLRKNLNLNPKFRNSYVPLGQAYVQKKLYSKAIDAFSQLPKEPFDLGADGLLFLSFTYAYSGDLAAARALLSKVSEQDILQCPYFTACVYVSLGNFADALTQLEHAYEIHAIEMTFLKVEPLLDPIRKEPRFKALLKKTNLE